MLVPDDPPGADEARRRLRPKPAASLILVDRAEREPRVLMGCRHGSHAFLPHLYVFPGGRYEADDAVVAAHHGPHHGAPQNSIPAERVAALACTAIRETFEETGYCLGVRRQVHRPVPATWRAFAARGLEPNVGALHLLARAITPVGRPRRFDALFFCAEVSAITDHAAEVVHDGSELLDLRWLPLDAARELPIVDVTRRILDVLERRLSDLAAPAPVPFFSWSGGRSRQRLL